MELALRRIARLLFGALNFFLHYSFFTPFHDWVVQHYQMLGRTLVVYVAPLTPYLMFLYCALHSVLLTRAASS